GPSVVPEGAPPADSTAKPIDPKPPAPSADWSALEMLRSWQFYALVFLFIGSAQSGLLVIANAAPLLASLGKSANFEAGSIGALLVANAWILSAYGGLVNALGRVGTGFYSD